MSHTREELPVSGGQRSRTVQWVDAHRRVLLFTVAIVAVVGVWFWPTGSPPDRAAPDVPRPPDERPIAGLWLSARDLRTLPTRGQAWERLREVADDPLEEDTDLGQRDSHNVQTLANALVGERLDDDVYRDRALVGLETVMETPPEGDLLAASRRLVTYAIAADILQLESLDPRFDRDFRRWLHEMRHHRFDERSFGASIIDAAEARPNNWGTHAGASRVAAAVYLDDDDELERAAEVFQGWLGDRNSYAEFEYGASDWQADPARPVGVNPAGSRIQGHSVDGVLPDDQRRAGAFSWPPEQENYVWEALQGATVQAELLRRRGYPAWQWEDQAMLRAVEWLHDQAGYPAEGDDRWIPWLVNQAYDRDFPAQETSPGKNMGFTDWTHGWSGVVEGPDR